MSGAVRPTDKWRQTDEVSRSLQEARQTTERHAAEVKRLLALISAETDQRVAQKRLDWGDAGSMGALHMAILEVARSLGLEGGLS
jgi:hypothetical protein